MTVQQLIEKLQTLNPKYKVVVEERAGDEHHHVKEERISTDMMTEEDGFLDYTCDEDTEGEMMIVIRL